MESGNRTPCLGCGTADPWAFRNVRCVYCEACAKSRRNARRMARYWLNKPSEQEYARAYRERCAEQLRAYRAAHAEANRDQKRTRDRAWYEANRDKVLARMAAKRSAGPARPLTVEQRARQAARCRAWYAESRDKAVASIMRWQANNRSAVKHHGRLRRARERSATIGPRFDWDAILEYFGHACAYCLRTDRPLTQDHVKPVAGGGRHSEENVIPACKPCNSRKGARGILYMLRFTT